MEYIKNNSNNEVYTRLIEKFAERPVIFLEEKSRVDFEEVERVRENLGASFLYACDFTIDDIEPYEKDGYFQKGGVINIDHHSESANYKRKISSANLAIEYIRNHPNFLPDTRALTHHTDCDSVLSTAIMAGILAPEDRFGDAAIAADHTGRPDQIADLLQALKDGPNGDIGEKSTSEHNQSKYLYSLEQLQRLLSSQDLDEKAKILLEKRLQERKLLQEMVLNGEVEYVGGKNEVAYLESEKDKLDPTLLIDMLPNTKVIFIARIVDSTKTIINARLGLAITEGSDLRDIMNAVNEPFGGRWNAGSNKRKGGSSSYAKDIAQKIANYLEII